MNTSGANPGDKTATKEHTTAINPSPTPQRIGRATHRPVSGASSTGGEYGGLGRTTWQALGRSRLEMSPGIHTEYRRLQPPGLLFAAATATQHGEVVGINREPETRCRRPGQACKQIVGGFDHGPALLAHQVPMGGSSKVVGGWSMAEMGMDDDAQLPGDLRDCDRSWTDGHRALWPGPPRPALRRSGGPSPRISPVEGVDEPRLPVRRVLGLGQGSLDRGRDRLIGVDGSEPTCSPLP